MKRLTEAAAIAVFHGKTERSNDANACWPWLGAINANGYGQATYQGRVQTASRIAWQITNGPIPKGLCVCHSCDNPRCVRPDHLFLGTHRDNMRDMFNKGRCPLPQRPAEAAAKGEAHGRARLTEAQVIEIRRVAGTRTNVALAAEYGVSNQLVGLIVQRRVWRHLSQPVDWDKWRKPSSTEIRVTVERA